MNLDEVFIIFGLTLIKNYNSVVSSLKWRCDGMYFIGSMWMLNVIMYIDGLWQLLAHRNKSIYITGYIVILVTILSLVKISHYHMIPFCKKYFLKNNNLGIETKILVPRFSLQKFSKSVTRWPQIHILHCSASWKINRAARRCCSKNPC